MFQIVPCCCRIWLESGGCLSPSVTSPHCKTKYFHCLMSPSKKGCGVLVSDDLAALPDVEYGLGKFAECIGWKFSVQEPAG